jgi:hypothetical protein
MSDLLSEIETAGLRIEEVARFSKTHFSTVFRWITKGVPGADGQRVCLEALRIGGRWWTSRPAFKRFVGATTPNQLAPPMVMRRSPIMRQRASERAAERLSQAGI